MVAQQGATGAVWPNCNSGGRKCHLLVGKLAIPLPPPVSMIFQGIFSAPSCWNISVMRFFLISVCKDPASTEQQ